MSKQYDPRDPWEDDPPPSREDPCRTCHGYGSLKVHTGTDDTEYTWCPACYGTGERRLTLVERIKKCLGLPTT